MNWKAIVVALAFIPSAHAKEYLLAETKMGDKTLLITGNDDSLRLSLGSVTMDIMLETINHKDPAALTVWGCKYGGGLINIQWAHYQDGYLWNKDNQTAYDNLARSVCRLAKTAPKRDSF